MKQVCPPDGQEPVKLTDTRFAITARTVLQVFIEFVKKKFDRCKTAAGWLLVGGVTAAHASHATMASLKIKEHLRRQNKTCFVDRNGNVTPKHLTASSIFLFLKRFTTFVKTTRMAEIKGIITRRDANGRITEITIDTNQHPQAIELLQNAGLVEKTAFHQQPEEGLTIEEARQRTLEKVRSWKWPK